MSRFLCVPGARVGARGTEDAEETEVGGGEVERFAARCWEKKGKLNVVSAARVKRNYTRGRAACTSRFLCVPGARVGARGTEDAEKTAVGGGEVERFAARCWGDYLDILIHVVTDARK
ncbi:hypothetical protein NDU88_004595 [Pleurodeles waltl]|uniref:Uncharacterized protein n=1 Tax=Pleurodeles waltl TaxID=8319 RepID=A0AAV7MUC9_PLEWA|nr:hypothetical protein NDU88_004595 [Pleurodeles waltl]